MDKQLRVYTKRNLKPSFFNGIFRKYSVTGWIIIINILVFVLALLSINFIGEGGAEKVFTFLGIQPILFFSGAVWTLITSMFMHVNFTHLFVNMISLFFIGSFIEKLVGRKRFFWLYMISGIFAGLLFVFLAYFFGTSDLGARIVGSPQTLAVGASGAIFALGGLLAILTPKMRVYVMFVIPMQMWVAMVVLLGGFWLASIFGNLPVGNTAHFGGLLVGVAYGVFLRKKYPKKTAMLARSFS
jgi:uncharacterized protein